MLLLRWPLKEQIISFGCFLQLQCMPLTKCHWFLVHFVINSFSCKMTTPGSFILGTALCFYGYSCEAMSFLKFASLTPEAMLEAVRISARRNSIESAVLTNHDNHTVMNWMPSFHSLMFCFQSESSHAFSQCLKHSLRAVFGELQVSNMPSPHEKCPKIRDALPKIDDLGSNFTWEKKNYCAPNISWKAHVLAFDLFGPPCHTVLNYHW